MTLLSLTFGAWSAIPAYAAGSIIRVTSTATAAWPCGSDWAANACPLQTALANAVSGDEIWVQAGTHKPSATGDRSATFQLKTGVAVYGGFAGTETAVTDRNSLINVTILSGDLLGDDSGFTNNAENSYHVVTGVTGATIDGFTIRGGNANGGDGCPGSDCGGGMLNSSSSPAVANVIFSGNSAFLGGGGMGNADSSPALTNVTFAGNRATASGGLDNYGGGLLNFAITAGNPSSPTLVNVTFSNNQAGYGAGMCNYSFGDGTESSPSLTNVTFSGNQAEFSGGGIYSVAYSGVSSPVLNQVTFSGNQAGVTGGGMTNESNLDTSGGQSSPALTDVTFDGNSSGNGGGIYNYSSGTGSASSPTLLRVTFKSNTAANGGGMYNFGVGEGVSSPVLTNVTFSGNTASTNGGGMYNQGQINGVSSPVLTNVTFNGNTAPASSGGGLYNTSNMGGVSSPVVRNSIFWGETGGEITNNSSTPTVSDSVVQGGYGANSSADPLLGMLGNYGGGTETVPLLPGSSAIDAGNATTCANAPVSGKDQRGLTRPSACDIGAFESQGFTLTKTGGDNQIAPTNTAFTDPLTLTVSPKNESEPVENGVITFTAPAVNASTNPAINTAIIASGAISKNVTANGVMGSYTVTASASGATSVNFSLTNQAEPPGNALSLDGTSEYVTAPDDANLNFTGAFTLEAWIYKNGSFSGWSGIIRKGNYYLTGIQGTDRVRFGLVDTSPAEYDSDSLSGIPNNQWVHIAGVYDGANLIIYINGVLDISTNIGSHTVLSSSWPLNLGESSGFYFNGRLDEVRLWNTARTQTQIQSNLYHTLTGAETGLAAYYNFDQTAGTILPDLTGNGNNGTLVNAPDWTTADWNYGYPYVTTGAATSITNSTASVDGTLVDAGVLPVTTSGVCYGVTVNPTTPCTTSGFPGALTGLTSGTPYHARTYASNFYGTSYGQDTTLTTKYVPIIVPGVSVSVTMSEDGAPTIWSTPLISASDGDGDTLTWTLNTAAAHGTAIVSGTGASPTITYAPTADYNGTDTFVVQVADADGSDTITVIVSVQSVPDAPLITETDPVSVTMSENGNPTPFALTLNATDPDTGDTLTWSISSVATNGTASASGTGLSKAIYYTPNPNYSGEDSFVVQVSDGGLTDTITVNVTIQHVNHTPVAVNDPTYTTSEDTELTVIAASGVLRNDSDIDISDTLTAVLVTAPAHSAAFTLNADGSFTYTPNANWNGVDTFTYAAFDGLAASTPATVTITVSVTMSENGTPTPFALTLNASDADGDTLTWSISTPATSGTASASGTGNSNALSYIPNTDYSGADSFVVQVWDGALMDTITVNVTIQPSSNTAPLAVNDKYTTYVNGTLKTTVANGVLVNDTDADSDPLTAVKPVVRAPAHAQSFIFNSDGTFTYVPVKGYLGTDSFTYRATDGKSTSNVATVTITVSLRTALFRSVALYDGWVMEKKRE